MATNIEIKARINDLTTLKTRAEALSDTQVRSLPQEDTFFHVANGRLKLRVTAGEKGQLIYYERDDTAGPKRSDYTIFTTADPESLKGLLAAALGVRGVVRKQRWLYWVDNTRIHLDEVEGLGTFLELEVVLTSEQSAGEGRLIAEKLMAQLGVEPADLIDGAYIDLLETPFHPG